ncbi:uncharacterized protein LOC108912357 [Anoplophora glabripennis]|uniref:uncharacterized protein LOC108912357 n=1 Tax=Anoplophora glabripennis TaxID=217634 RepID=UPI000873DA68|nr:uncharacterized protein LOC108912357 [Anoplophora glabripennis]
MISLKLFSVLSTFLLLQVQCDILLHGDTNEEKIIDIAEIALKALEKIVDTLTNVSFTTLKTLESTIRSTERLILKFAKFEIDELSDEIFQKLDEIKKEANIIAVDIIDCTEDREQDLKDMLANFLNRTGDCAVNRVNEVLDSLGIVVMDIHNVNDEVKNITVQLENCENDSNAVACIIEVIKIIQKEATEVPAKLREDVDEAEKKVNELIDYLFECEHDNINELEMVVQEIYNGIVECVQGKILTPDVILLN